MSYETTNAISYSYLSKLSIHPASLDADNIYKDEDKSHFNLGGCVDDLLTSNNFEEKYIIKDFEPLTGLMLELYNNIKKEIAEKQLKNEIVISNDYLLSKVKELGLYSNIKNEELIIKKFDDNFKGILDSLFLNDNKKIISMEEYILSKRIAESLANNYFTCQYFSKIKNVETFSQYEIYWKYLDQNIKCKLDKLIIDHNNKTITPIDIKTMGEYTSLFSKSFIKWKYYYQASLYSAAVYYNITKGLLPDYKVLPFTFIVETTMSDYIGEPKIFEVSENTLKIANSGGILNINNYDYNIVGWHQLIEDKIWYDENGYKHPREYIVSKGKYIL